MEKWKYIITWIVITQSYSPIPQKDKFGLEIPGTVIGYRESIKLDTVSLEMIDRDSAFDFYSELSGMSFKYSPEPQFISTARIDSLPIMKNP